MSHLADRVKETCLTPGVGSVTLLGASSGYQSFATAFPTGTRETPYAIADQAGPNWEVGTGEFQPPSTLVRLQVLSSSNAGALVNFSAGTQDVFVTAPAQHIKHSTLGLSYAMSRGMAMP